MKMLLVSGLLLVSPGIVWAEGSYEACVQTCNEDKFTGDIGCEFAFNSCIAAIDFTEPPPFVAAALQVCINAFNACTNTVATAYRNCIRMCWAAYPEKPKPFPPPPR